MAKIRKAKLIEENGDLFLDYDLEELDYRHVRLGILHPDRGYNKASLQRQLVYKYALKKLESDKND